MRIELCSCEEIPRAVYCYDLGQAYSRGWSTAVVAGTRGRRGGLVHTASYLRLHTQLGIG